MQNPDFGKTAPQDMLISNPKAPLREQLRKVMRFHHCSPRTEEAYWQWVKRLIFFHNKRHPKHMGPREVSAFLSHLTTANDAAMATQRQALNAFVLECVTGFPDLLFCECPICMGQTGHCWGLEMLMPTIASASSPRQSANSAIANCAGLRTPN